MKIKTSYKNSINYKAIYQDYDWCYQKFIVEQKSFKEMAIEAECSKRVIEKWCGEKFKLNNHTLKDYIKLSDIQKQVIMFGLLGDGHIDKREKFPMYIESHAENQKDYLLWKYDILKNLCNKEPFYSKPCSRLINGTLCNVQGQYRLNTKVVSELSQIRNMSKKHIINELNEFGLSLHMLDDGCRGKYNWELCVAEYNTEEKDLYISVCLDKFNLHCHTKKDDRYIIFDSASSKILDNIILNNVPNNLDIINYKILIG